jgi:class 3 adenylate cyclase/tetratricopeptide (TPR) repeat protein
VGDIGRELRAALRADMVASTESLTGSGIEASIAARSWYRRAVAQACPAGITIDSRGDGVLIAFRSAQAAVAAALTLEHAARAADFELRLAVTLHEVAENEVVIGELEQRSAGIEAQCPPGWVIVDDRTRRAVRGWPAVDFVPVPETPEVYRVFYRLSGTPGSDSSSAELRAVLFTDLSDHSDLSDAVDGDVGAVASALSASAITAAGGIIVDGNGAGHVGFFATCSAALTAATALHDAAASARLRADGNRGLRFSAGVSVGDVVVAGGAGFGVPIVEAARLLDLADAGTTALTDDVASMATIDDAHMIEVGVVELKGMPEATSMKQIVAGGVRSLLELPPVFRATQTFPIIGRQSSLEALERLWEESLLGDLRAAVVSGEEGIGKTRLVRELARTAHENGATVLFGVCDEDLRVPYAPIATALAGAAALDAEIESAMLTGEGALGMLLGSDDAMSHQRASRPEWQNVDQVGLFSAAASALATLAAERPVLLVIDDIQWADVDTMRMIEHIVTHSDACRVMIVATCRAEELDRDHPAQMLFQATRLGHRVAHCRLDRLSSTDIVAMLESRTGHPLLTHQIEFAAKVAEITGGSPLYAEELVVDLASTGVLVNDPDVGWSLTVEADDMPIPDSIIDLMARRWNRLGSDAVEMLVIAAVMGSSFELEVLSDVADSDIATVLDAVEAAESARLLRENDTGGSCTFSDEISRAALLRELRPSRRALVHERIAVSLERIRPQLTDQLVVHWSASIGGEARRRAVHYLRLAGERDMAAAAWESSVDRHRKVLELLAVDAIDDDGVLGDVRYRLGASLRKIGDAAYRAELLRAASHARRAGDADLLMRSAFAMMRPGAWYPEAMIVDEDIVAICEDLLLLLDVDDPRRPRVLAALATNITYRGDEAHRWRITKEAQQLAETTGDLRLVGTTLAAELISFHAPDLFIRRRELAAETQRIGRATGDRDLLFIGSWFQVLEMVQAGDLAAAIRLVDEVRPVVEAAREYWPSFLLSHFETAISIARCAPNALELIERQRSSFEHQPVDSFGVSVIQQATVAMGHGTLSDMLLPFAEAADEHNDDAWARKWNYAFSKAYLDAGEVDKALAAIALNPEPDFDNYWLASTYHLGLVGLLSQRTDICRKVIGKLEAFRGRFAIVGLGACVSGHISTSLGQAHMGLGDLDSAEALFREAAEHSDRAEFAYFATNARRFLARTLLMKHADNREAQTILDRVLSDARQHGFALEQREAQRMRERFAGSSAT